MTGSSTRGTKTVLHPVPDLATARRWTPPCSASRRGPISADPRSRAQR
jgi:hypothetical protein